jgi:hypothetical protein
MKYAREGQGSQRKDEQEEDNQEAAKQFPASAEIFKRFVVDLGIAKQPLANFRAPPEAIEGKRDDVEESVLKRQSGHGPGGLRAGELQRLAPGRFCGVRAGLTAEQQVVE